MRWQFQRGSTADAALNLRLGDEVANHLAAIDHHHKILARYNITANRDAALRQQVESVARRVGLIVPEAGREQS